MKSKCKDMRGIVFLKRTVHTGALAVLVSDYWLHQDTRVVLKRITTRFRYSTLTAVFWDAPAYPNGCSNLRQSIKDAIAMRSSPETIRIPWRTIDTAPRALDQVVLGLDVATGHIAATYQAWGDNPWTLCGMEVYDDEATYGTTPFWHPTHWAPMPTLPRGSA